MWVLWGKVQWPEPLGQLSFTKRKGWAKPVFCQSGRNSLSTNVLCKYEVFLIHRLLMESWPEQTFKILCWDCFAEVYIHICIFRVHYMFKIADLFLKCIINLFWRSLCTNWTGNQSFPTQFSGFNSEFNLFKNRQPKRRHHVNEKPSSEGWCL